MTDPSPAATALRLALLAVSREAGSTEIVVQTLRLLGQQHFDDRSQRALKLAAREIGGDATTPTGRPPIDDAEPLRRIAEARARGVPRGTAIHAEASRLAQAAGGSIETHARRLRDKLKKDGENPVFPPSNSGTLTK